MADSIVVGESYIVRAPGILGGSPHIEGRRLGVHTIANLIVRGNASPEQVADDYDLTLAQVHAALAYYYDHPAEIDAILDENLRLEKVFSDPVRMAEMRAKTHELMMTRFGDADMTVAETAEQYEISEPTVRIAIKKGWLPARKSGATWLIKRRDAQARWGDR